MPSSLPSSYIQAGAKPPQQYAQKERQEQEPQRAEKRSGGGMGGLPLLIAIIALGISLLSLYTAYAGERPMTKMEREQIAGIANDLKSLQNKELSLYAPVQTRISINKTYPMRDLFPTTFNMPLEFSIPIDTEAVGLSSTGQPVRIKLEENVPIKTVIGVSSARAFGNSTITIDRTIPVDVELYSNVKIKSVYREEINAMVDKLERLAGEPAKE